MRKQLKCRAVDVERAAVKGALILVVEDNPVNAKVIATMTQQLGLVVHVVSNGREAWRRLREQTYGLLKTDCHMPVKGGYRLAQKIRRQEGHQGWYLPVVDGMRVLVDEVNDVVPEVHVVANNSHIEGAVPAR